MTAAGFLRAGGEHANLGKIVEEQSYAAGYGHRRLLGRYPHTQDI